MIDLIMMKLQDGRFMFSLMVAIAAAATVFTVAIPLLEQDTLRRRLKSVGDEREKMRMRERERFAKTQQKVTLRHEQKASLKRMSEMFNLKQWLGTDSAKERLAMAGFRGQNAELTFLFFRLVAPIAIFLMTLIYLFGVNDHQQASIARLGMSIGGAYLGIKLPELYLQNVIQKRQASIKRTWPDALDLMLICVESGMSIEQAFRKVAQEVGTQSVPLAEELSLATAELSYLQDRRVAYENLGTRTGLDTVKSICTALIQAERYGTPVGTALRVLSQESRDTRMNDAEKKAAALPPKLTVPMILFFLPVLFVVIMMPAMIEVYKWQ
jgi:tight adherence protein C